MRLRHRSGNLQTVVSLTAPIFRILSTIKGLEHLPLLQRNGAIDNFPPDFSKILRSIHKAKHLDSLDRRAALTYIQLITQLDPIYIKKQFEFFMSELKKFLSNGSLKIMYLKSRRQGTTYISNPEGKNLPTIKIFIPKREAGAYKIEYKLGDDEFKIALDPKRDHRLIRQLNDLIKAQEPIETFTPPKYDSKAAIHAAPIIPELHSTNGKTQALVKNPNATNLIKVANPNSPINRTDSNDLVTFSIGSPANLPHIEIKAQKSGNNKQMTFTYDDGSTESKIEQSFNSQQNSEKRQIEQILLAIKNRFRREQVKRGNIDQTAFNQFIQL